MTGIIVFSSKFPAAPHQAMVASWPITCAQTMSRLSAITGFTLPGMMLEPGWTSGSFSSPRPQRSAQERDGVFRSLRLEMIARFDERHPVRREISAITAAANPGGALSPVPTAVPPRGSS
jgi:hypothetical protein